MVSFVATAVGAATAAVLAIPSIATTAYAQSCSGTGANPAVFNFEVNGHPAKIIRDGERSTPVGESFFLEEEAVLSRALKRRFQPDTVDINFNVMYIDQDGEGVLVDTGLGTVSPTSLLYQLEVEGIAADSIRHIVLTHAHGDHVGGLLLEPGSDQLAFPNAQVYISRLEYEYWTVDPVRPLPAPGTIYCSTAA